LIAAHIFLVLLGDLVGREELIEAVDVVMPVLAVSKEERELSILV
jgi:hypothetical protein